MTANHFMAFSQGGKNVAHIKKEKFPISKNKHLGISDMKIIQNKDLVFVQELDTADFYQIQSSLSVFFLFFFLMNSK